MTNSPTTTKIKWKTSAIKEGWYAEICHPKLVEIILLTARFISIECPKYKWITITELIRTKAGQDKIYLNCKDLALREKYKKTPWDSVHQFGRGIDIRNSDMVKYPGMIEKLDKFLKLITYDPNRPTLKSVKVHDVGRGDHIHIQVHDPKWDANWMKDNK